MHAILVSMCLPRDPLRRRAPQSGAIPHPVASGAGRRSRSVGRRATRPAGSAPAAAARLFRRQSICARGPRSGSANPRAKARTSGNSPWATCPGRPRRSSQVRKQGWMPKRCRNCRQTSEATLQALALASGRRRQLHGQGHAKRRCSHSCPRACCQSREARLATRALARPAPARPPARRGAARSAGRRRTGLPGSAAPCRPRPRGCARCSRGRSRGCQSSLPCSHNSYRSASCHLSPAWGGGQNSGAQLKGEAAVVSISAVKRIQLKGPRQGLAALSLPPLLPRLLARHWRRHHRRAIQLVTLNGAPRAPQARWALADHRPQCGSLWAMTWELPAMVVLVRQCTARRHMGSESAAQVAQPWGLPHALKHWPRWRSRPPLLQPVQAVVARQPQP